MGRRRALLSVTEPEFQALVREALDGLPDEYAKRITNVAVVVEEEPSPEVLADLEMEEDEDLLGLYQGLSLDKESFFPSGRATAGQNLHLPRADPQTLPNQTRSGAGGARYGRARNRASFRV